MKRPLTVNFAKSPNDYPARPGLGTQGRPPATSVCSEKYKSRCKD